MLAVAVATAPAQYPCHACSCDERGVPPDGGRWKVSAITDANGEPFVSYVCPRKLVTARSWFFLDLYRHYKNGFLPCAGGLLEQPFSFVRAMAIIDEWMNKSGRS